MLFAVNDQEDAMFESFPMRASYASMVRRLLAQKGMVAELVEKVFEEMGGVEWVEVPGTRRPRGLTVRHDNIASIPAADGTCHFDRLPAELLKAVFAASLPPREDIIEPRCGDVRLAQRQPRPNRVADLLVLSKYLCGHVAETVYEERTFSIHVHQGHKNAGIEFIHVGRQPLQYQADIRDGRFSKFSPNDIFGFSRLKKLQIRIHPIEGKSRHTAINTYYMLHALVNLLCKREDKPETRITSLDINFVANYHHKPAVLQGRSKIMNAESPWWDTDNNKPCETSFHGISDIQLMLQPFARLYGVHNVDILAPEIVSHHQPTVDFVIALKRCMKGKSQSAGFNNTSLTAQLEGMRAVHEDYMMHGGTMVETDKLDDLRDDDSDHGDFGNDDDDDGDDAPRGPQDDPGDNDGSDDDGSEDDDNDGDGGPDAGMLQGEDVGHEKRELSLSPSGKEDAAGGRKRVHFSDNISTSNDHAPGESSRMDLDDSPTTSRNGVFGSRFLATGSEIDLMARFADIYDTTEEDARFWLSRSNWDLDAAASEFIYAYQGLQAYTLGNGSDEDAMRVGIAMSLESLGNATTGEGFPPPVRGRDMRAGRELDNETSPTRSGRANGPSAHTRAQRRRLLESYPTQEEEAEHAKVNGKGKGKAKKTDDGNDADDEEDGPSQNDSNNHDESIAKWNNPSNFEHQESNYERYNPHDTEMTDDVYGPSLRTLTAQRAASNALGALVIRPDNLPVARNALGDGLDPLYVAQLLEWTNQVSSDSEDGKIAFRPRGPRYNPTVPRVDRPYFSDSRPVYSSAPTPSVVRPRFGPPDSRPLSSSAIVRPPSEQEEESTAAVQGRSSMEERFLRVSNASNPTQAALSGLELRRQQRPALASQPSTPANTAADYPQWAGTSYWSVPAERTPARASEPAPAPAPEVPTTSSSSSSAANTTAPYFIRPATTTDNAIDNTTPMTRHEMLRDIYARLMGGSAAGRTAVATTDVANTASATTAPATTAPATAAPTIFAPATSSQYKANQEYWANFRPEFGDEVVIIPSDSSEGEL
jgi:hypothetical protein